MPRTNKTYQAPNCTWVTLQAHGQSYRLSISGTLYFDGKRKYVSLLGCRQNETGLRRAHQYQLRLQDDIDTGIFDSTLSKYSEWSNRAKYVAVSPITLNELWAWWLTIKKPLISDGTYRTKYNGILKNIIVKNDSEITELTVEKLYNYVSLNTNKHDGTKLFNELTKAYDRALALKKVSSINPFIGYSNKIIAANKKVINTKTITELLSDHSGKVAYTATERDLIIEWFVINKPYYAPYIYFKFYTGCRFNESVELRWHDVTVDFKTIFFRRSYVEISDSIKNTKTGKERRFNCSAELIAVLRIMLRKKRLLVDDDLIFKSEANTRLTKAKITNLWNRAVTELMACGAITGRLSQNHTRHTFNQLARLNNDKADVALQLGHSPATADLHYTDRYSGTTVLVL